MNIPSINFRDHRTKRSTPDEWVGSWVQSTSAVDLVDQALDQTSAEFWSDEELGRNLDLYIDELRAAETKVRKFRLRLEAIQEGSAKQCTQCGRRMFARAGAKYCSPACRVAASRNRAAAKAVQVTTNVTPEQNQRKTLRPGQVMDLDGKVYPGRSTDVTRRNEYIRYRRDQGATIRVIAGEAGCSVGTVQRVIKR